MPFSKSEKSNIIVLKEALEKVNQRSVFVFLCFFFLASLTLILTDGLVSLGSIHSGIKINSVEIGDLTPNQACRKIEAKLKPSLKQTVKITYLENQWQVTPQQFNTKISVVKSAAKAYSIGREGGLISQLQQRASCWIQTKALPLVYSVDSKLMSSFIDDMAKKIDVKPVDASIQIRDEEPKITPSQSGIKLNRAETFSLIEAKLVSIGSRSMKAPVSIIPVEITEENAKAALEDTSTMMRSPLTIRYAERSWSIRPGDIGSLITFKKVPKKKNKKVLELRADLDSAKVKGYIAELTKDLSVGPQSAEFRVDGKAVIIIPSKTGVKVDTDAALAKMKKVLSSHPPRSIMLVTKVVEPERTTEEADAMGIKERISVFSTSFSSSNTPRVANINLLAKDLDGTIVAPGKVFSFNETIGPRTAEKGYKEAPAIVQGELVPSVGGGVCQVATTLFNAIFFAGYPIASRQNHSFYISHYPPGRDATVAWEGPDLKFKNDTDTYLLIKTWPSSSSITVAIYSTSYKTEVSYTATKFANFTPFQTKYVNDSAVPKGQQIPQESGVEGRDITVFRTVKRNGKVAREDKFFSRYKPKQAVVRVGTMEPAPPSQPTPSETQTAQ